MTDEKLVTRTVLFDRVAYFVHSDLAPNKRQRMVAVKGDEISLPEAEAKRLEGLKAVGTPEQLLAQQTAAQVVTTPTSPAELRTMTVGDLMAFLASATESQGESVEAWMEELANEAQAAAETKTAELRGETDTGQGGKRSEEELSKMGAADLIAYLSQHPEDVDLVEEVNEAKGEKAYSTVTDAVQKTREELANA